MDQDWSNQNKDLVMNQPSLGQFIHSITFIFTAPPPTKLREGNVFTPVGLFTGMGMMSCPICLVPCSFWGGLWCHFLSGPMIFLGGGSASGGVAALGVYQKTITEGHLQPEAITKRPLSTKGVTSWKVTLTGLLVESGLLLWPSDWKWPSVMAFWYPPPYWRAVCILLECILVNYLVFSDLKKSGIWKKNRISFVLVYLSFLPEAFVLWTVIHHVHTPTKMIIAIVWFIAIKRRVREVGLSLLQFLFITDLWLIWPPQELQYLNFIYRHSTHC